jgi:hypothetical protein
MIHPGVLAAELAALDPRSISTAVARHAAVYLDHPSFSPAAVAPVCAPAAKLCQWALGVMEARKWESGSGHARIDTLLPAQFNSSSTIANNSSSSSSMPLGTDGRGGWLDDWKKDSSGGTAAATATAGMNATAVSVWQGQQQSTADTADSSMQQQPQLSSFAQKLERKRRELAAAATAASANSTATTAGREGGASSASPEKRSALLRTHQARVADRLADARALAPDLAGFELRRFTTCDGAVIMPYAVCGTPCGPPSTTADSTSGNTDAAADSSSTADQQTAATAAVAAAAAPTAPCNLVVVHDFFDTLEKTFLLVRPLVLEAPGCQVLCLNTPGQAGTRCPAGSTLSSDWLADRLAELLTSVDTSAQMPLSTKPWHIVGIGNGAAVAAAYALRYGPCSSNTSASSSSSSDSGTTATAAAGLRAVVSVNGFATVDSQLAAVLHAAAGAFAAFPPQRPDLPVAFWSRFLFSASYIAAVGRSLALNLHTAVANPVGCDGMAAIVRGALAHRDVSALLPALPLPLVLLQSTDDALVNASNVDAFLRGRVARHTWSHQLQLAAPWQSVGGCLGADGRNALAATLSEGGGSSSTSSSSSSSTSSTSGSSTKGGAFVLWAPGGHAVQQECKRAVTDLLRLMITLPPPPAPPMSGTSASDAAALLTAYRQRVAASCASADTTAAASAATASAATAGAAAVAGPALHAVKRRHSTLRKLSTALPSPSVPERLVGASHHRHVSSSDAPVKRQTARNRRSGSPDKGTGSSSGSKTKTAAGTTNSSTAATDSSSELLTEAHVQGLNLPWEDVSLDQAVAEFESAMRQHRAQRAQGGLWGDGNTNSSSVTSTTYSSTVPQAAVKPAVRSEAVRGASPTIVPPSSGAKERSSSSSSSVSFEQALAQQQRAEEALLTAGSIPATSEQRSVGQWTNRHSSTTTAEAAALAEAQLAEKLTAMKALREKDAAAAAAAAAQRTAALAQAAAQRAEGYAQQDAALVAGMTRSGTTATVTATSGSLSSDAPVQLHSAELARLQGAAEAQEADDRIAAYTSTNTSTTAASTTAASAAAATADVVRAMRPQQWTAQSDLPHGIAQLPAADVLSTLERDAAAAAAAGRVTIAAFAAQQEAAARQQLAAAAIAAAAAVAAAEEAERLGAEGGAAARAERLRVAEACARRLQCVGRGFLGRRRAAVARVAAAAVAKRSRDVLLAQRVVRGHLARRRVAAKRQLARDEMVVGSRALAIQRCYR